MKKIYTPLSESARFTRAKQALLGCSLLFSSLMATAQYTQNFDQLTATGMGTFSNLPAGWGIYEVGTGTAADGKYAVGTGSSNTGNTYSFGAASSTERALGTVASGSNFPSFGVILFNEGETPITEFTITYVGEQYRFGGRTTGTKDQLKFEYSLDAAGIVNNVGTWVNVPALNFQSIITPLTSTAAVLDGNLPANRITLTATITGVTIEPGKSIILRWSDADIAGNDDGLAIDSLTVTGAWAPGEMSSGGTNVGGGSGSSGGSTVNIPVSTPVFEHKAATDSGFIHLYGNLHGHSTHSDGKPSSLQPKDDYDYARQAEGMDFLGISEHNHATAGLQIADYKIGYQQAEQANGLPNKKGQPFITLHGMEWGTISGGGHVLVYGMGDSVLNWEPGNYDVFVEKSDYKTLFEKVRNVPGAFATLAHPNTTDYTNLTTGYKGLADTAVVSVAIESGPATSKVTDYTDFPSSLAYMSYYKKLLRLGYRVAAQMDQDNHEMTFGTANANRMVVLAKERTREALVSGIQQMRVYASNDYNAQVSFTMDGFVMGSTLIADRNITGSIQHTDADGEALSAVQVYGGPVGGNEATLIHSATGNTTFATAQQNGETWYYFAIITQQDGNKIVTAPIWVTTEIPLPKNDLKLKAHVKKGVVELDWKMDRELYAAYFIVEVSKDGKNFTAKDTVPAVANGTDYSYVDMAPYEGASFYRITLIHREGGVSYSETQLIEVKKPTVLTVYPNPATTTVTVRLNEAPTGTYLVQLVDAAGNMVLNKTENAATFKLDLSGYANGYYVLRVGNEITRLVITR